MLRNSLMALVLTGCVVRTAYSPVVPQSAAPPGVAVDGSGATVGLTPSAGTSLVSSDVGVALDARWDLQEHVDLHFAVRPSAVVGTTTTCAWLDVIFCGVGLGRSAVSLTGSGALRLHGGLGRRVRYGVEVGPTVYGLERHPGLGLEGAGGLAFRAGRLHPFAEVRLRGTLADTEDRWGHWAGLAGGLDIRRGGFALRPFVAGGLGSQQVERRTRIDTASGRTMERSVDRMDLVRLEGGLSLRFGQRPRGEGASSR